MILIVSRQEKELIARLRKLEPFGDAAALQEQISTLKREIADLEIAKSKRQEDFDRRERELRHMVGLEKQQQESDRRQLLVEAEQKAQAASLSVREENLAVERKRFEEQLVFNTERFTQMEKYLKDMMADILQRLPNVNVEFSRREKMGG